MPTNSQPAWDPEYAKILQAIPAREFRLKSKGKSFPFMGPAQRTGPINVKERRRCETPFQT